MDILDVVSTVSTRIKDKLKLKQIFINTGKEIWEFEYGKEELSDLLKCIFSEENMNQMYQFTVDLDRFQWSGKLRAELGKIFKSNTIGDAEAKKYIDCFVDTLIANISKEFPEEYNSLYLKKMDEHIDDVCSTEIEIFGCVKEIRNVVIGIEQNLLYKKDNSIPYEECNTIDNSIPVNDYDVEWRLEHIHVNGVFATTEQQAKEIRELTKLWKNEREAYPDWYILSYMKANELKRKTLDQGLLFQKNLVDTDEILIYAYEYMWRYNTCMYPIDKGTQQRVFEIWNSYFEKYNEERNKEIPYGYEWFYLGKCLLREYREKAYYEEWEYVYDILKEYNIYDTRQGLELWLEQIRMFYSLLNLRAVVNEIESMKIAEDEYEIRFQVAGILADCGKQNEAINILLDLEEKIGMVVGDINNKQEDNLHLLSLLECCYLLHSYLLRSKNIIEKQEWNINPDENAIRENIVKYKVFFNYDDNIQYIEKDILRWQFSDIKKKKTPFDINRETITIVQMGDSRCESAYYFYRLLEKCALPRESRNVTFLPDYIEFYVCKALLEICPPLGINYLLSGSNKKNIEILIDRSFIAKHNYETITEFLEYILDALKFNLHEFKYHDGWGKQDLYSSVLHNGIELLRRLSSRSSNSSQSDIIGILIALLNENCVNEYGEMDGLICSLGQHLSEGVKAKEFNNLMKSSIKKRNPCRGRIEQTDIFDVLCRKEQATILFKNAEIDSKYINKMINKGKISMSERRVYLLRLMELYRLEKMSKDQVEKFCDLLWFKTDSITGLPDMPDLYLFNFINLPSPVNVDVIEMIKKYLLTADWVSELDNSTGCKMTFGEIRYFDELYLFNQNIKEFPAYYWNSKEGKILIDTFASYWENNKNKLMVEDKYIKYEFEKRFKKLQRIILSILECSKLIEDNTIKDLLKNMYYEMEACKLPSLRFRIYLESNWSSKEKIMDIVSCLYEKDKIISTMDAIYYLITERIVDKETTCFLIEKMISVANKSGYVNTVSIINTIHNFFYCGKLQFETSTLVELCEMLELMVKVTSYDKCSTEEEIKHMIAIRKSCASLAFQMSQYYEKKKEELPDVIESWHQICCGDEFNVVKNEWIL